MMQKPRTDKHHCQEQSNKGNKQREGIRTLAEQFVSRRLNCRHKHHCREGIIQHQFIQTRDPSASNFLACPAKYPSPNTKNTGKRTVKAVRVIVAGVSKPYRITNPRKPGSEMGSSSDQSLRLRQAMIAAANFYPADRQSLCTGKRGSRGARFTKASGLRRRGRTLLRIGVSPHFLHSGLLS